MVMRRAHAELDLTVKATQPDRDNLIITGVASTPTPDRVGDIVVPTGAQFKLPIPLLLHHDHRLPVGIVYSAKATKTGVTFEARLPRITKAGLLKDRVDEAIDSIEHGILRGISIGFRALKDSVEVMDDGLKFLKWLWLENSLVAVPANAEASVTAIKSIDRRLFAASGVQEKSVVWLSSTPAAVADDRGSKETDVKTIAEQLAALTASRAEKTAKMQSIMQKSIDESRSTDADEAAEFDTLQAEIKAIDADIVRLKALEAMNVQRATPVAGGSSNEASTTYGGDASASAPNATATGALPNTLQLRTRLEKGIRFARFAMCAGAARGDYRRAADLAKTYFADTPELADTLARGDDLPQMMKAAVAGATTTDSTWAAPLVTYNQYTQDFVEFLRPRTIIGRFGQGNIPALRSVPFNVHIRGQTSGGSGYWVGQGKPKPLTKFDYNDAYLGWAKVANIAVFSEELERFSDPSAQVLIRDGLAGALIERLDTDFVDPAKAAVANVSPASISYGVTPVVSSGNDADAIRVDIKALMSAYIIANITPTSGVWLMSATTALALSLMRNALGQKEFPEITMMGGMFEGLPVIVSEYLTADTSGGLVILANASDIWLADDGQIQIAVSREASLQMLDNPTNASDDGTATSMVSMFQTNSVAMRAERFINWSKRRASAVQVLTGVNWGT